MLKRVIYWFRKDLRIDDNRAFLKGIKSSREIIPVFIFEESSLEKYKIPERHLGFIIDCVKKLSDEIISLKGKLYCLKSDNLPNAIEFLIVNLKPEAIFTIKDYSLTGEKVNKEIEKICKKYFVNFLQLEDNFLASPENIPYKKVFTPFYKNWLKNIKLEPTEKIEKIYTPTVNLTTLEDIAKAFRYSTYKKWKLEELMERVEEFDYSQYEKFRDRLDMDATSKFSPLINFGVVSLRRIYLNAINRAGKNCQFVKELAWREFWYHIRLNFPEISELEFQEKRRGIKWENNEKLIKALFDAKTGYPIIDAAINQLKQENWMHNRARMIVANFLTKNLLTDWRIGEKFFAEYLIDYDEIVNIGNWQWNASVGPDPKPFRIFNPMLQAKKFDPDCKYIKKYIPELSKVPCFMLHDPLKYKLPYYEPVINYYESILRAKELYFSSRIAKIEI